MGLLGHIITIHKTARLWPPANAVIKFTTYCRTPHRKTCLLVWASSSAKRHRQKVTNKSCLTEKNGTNIKSAPLVL